MPFKVIQGHRFWYQSKLREPVCDFLLVNNTNFRPTCLRLPDTVPYQIIAFDLSITNSFLESSENIAMSHILLKSRFFGLHFCCGQYSYLQPLFRSQPPKLPNSVTKQRPLRLEGHSRSPSTNRKPM